MDATPSPVDQLVAAQSQIALLTTDLKAANDLLAESQGQLAALTAERDTARSNADGLIAQINKLTAKSDQDLATATAGLLDARNKITGLEAQLSEPGRLKAIQDGITTAVAANGHKPLPIGGVDSAQSTEDPSLSPRERLAANFNKDLQKRGLIPA